MKVLINRLRRFTRLSMLSLATVMLAFGNHHSLAATYDWGVSESGLPGIFSWQHLYNWNAFGLHQSPTAIPSVAGDVANLNLLTLTGNQTINLDGAVTLGTLNLGSATGTRGYVIAAGTGGTLTFDGGALSALNKTALGTDTITANIALTGTAPLAIDVNDGILALTGVVSGAGGFTKTGDGTLILRGASTYTGVTTLSGGQTIIAATGNNTNVLGANTAGNETIVNAGATLALIPDQLGADRIDFAERVTINGDGFRNNGALRGFMGVNGNQFTGIITMGSAARIQNDAGTFTIGAAFVIDQTLTAGGIGFVDIGGAVSGSSDIIHFGLGGFRMRNTGTTQTYSGALTSLLGEIRSDYGTDGLPLVGVDPRLNPYAGVTSLTLKDSWLRMAYGNAAGSATDDGTLNSTQDSRFSTTAPISMKSSQIYIDNASFTTTATSFFDYAVIQHLGVTTMTGGHNRIGFRSADTGSVTLTFADLQKPNQGTTLELLIDSLVGASLGTSAKHRIINTDLEGGGNIPLVGGWLYSAGGTASPEFVKYGDTTMGGFGYTTLAASDYAIDTAVGTWAAGQNIKITSGNRTITANAEILSLNMQNATARTLSGDPGTTLEVGSGGIITSGGAHTISVPFLTAGAASNYELYDIAWGTNVISSDITDNGANAVSLVKTGGGTTSFLTGNSYTGTTYINEGMFRGVIGSKAVALGSGNLTFGGSPSSQAIYENDGDFTRALGTGVGQVQLLGGGGLGSGSTGFSAFGAPIDLNFGGAGATVLWGSAAFDPGIFTLNGGNATHVVTLVNDLDLGGEQRYIRLDGSASGAGRAVIGIMDGDISNGSIVKRGGGILLFENAKNYQNGTILNEGELWLRGTGTAGANVIGNDIQINVGAKLLIESPSNIGSRQMIILQNNDNNTPAVISFGAGYGTGADITFSSFGATSGIGGTGGNNIFIANTGQASQARRVAVTISGNGNFQNDVLGQIREVAPTVEAWFGADGANGIFTGTTLSPSGGTGTQNGTLTAAPAYRLGGHTNNGGVLTIAKANVLTDTALGVPTPLIIGAPNQTDRNYTDGTIYIPKTQSYSGQLTIGSGGILQVGENGALGTGTFDINLRAGELRLDVAGGNYGGAVGTQYAARNLNIAGGTGTIRTTTLGGGGFNTVVIGDLTFGEANRILQIFSIGTNFTDLAVNNVNLFNSTNTAFFNVGIDNSFQSGAGTLTVNGIIGDQVTGLQSIQKNNGGVLVLNGANTYDGSTIVNQGRLVLSNTSAASTGTISMAAAGTRTAGLEYRINGAGPFIFNNPLTTSGGDANSTRIITVGPTGPGSEDRLVSIPSLTINNAGGYTVGAGGSSAIFFDGFNGYGLEVSGDVTLTSSINLRTRGAVTTFNGVVSGAGALEKHEQGTLILNGANTYTGTTTISNGYLIAGDNAALGNAGSDIIFRNNVFSQILASGVRTIGRNFINTATGDIQTLGGLDGGAKLFGGNVNLSTRGIALTSFTGGDTTFSGVISGGFGVDKQGNGTVILDPGAGTGNTYTGVTTVTQGLLIGQAQATSGSPFGTGGMTITDATVRLLGQAAAATTTTSAGALTVSGGSRIGVQDTSGGTFATTLNFGSLVRSGAAGTVTFVPVTGVLGTFENFTFAAAPTLVNTIIGPWAVASTTAVNNSATYVTYAGGVTGATYGGTGSIDTVTGSTQVFDATGGTLTADRSVFAFRTDTNIDLAGFRLAVGDTATPANGGGIILNNGADINGIAGSRINIENTALSIYVDDAAVSSLNVPIRNFRSNATNTLTTVLTKFGPGTLEIGAVQEFEGNIELARGTLSFTAPNVLPFFSNLAGTSGSILFMSPGTTVSLNNNNQEFGNLSAVNTSNSFQFSAGTIDLGTARLTVGREDSSQTFNGQILGGAGSVFQKVGVGRLILDNINGNKPSTVESVMVDRGVLRTWLNDNSWATPTTNTSAIPSSATIYLRGGEWEAYAIGDSTSNQQRIQIGNNVIHRGADSIMDSNRATGSGSNKLLVYGNLTLDVQRLLFTGGNTFIPRFDGDITLTNHARVQNDSQAVFQGVISDGGNGYTLNKIGNSDLSIGGDNSATWSGGLVVTGGTLLFGTRGLDDIRSPGTTIVPLATANAGTGDIIVNQGSAIRITAPSNILTGSGQEVRIYGSERGSTTRVDLLTDALITDYGLRSLTDGSIALGLSDGLWTTPINLAKLGSGQWGISALSNTFYTADTLGATVDNRYIFSGTAAAILTITNANVLTGTASVELGKSPVFPGATPAGSGASIRLYDNQNYTGNTTIFRQADAGSIGAILELTGDSASPVFDVYGRLTLRGAGRLTDDTGAQVNTLNLRPGGNLRLDYIMDVNDSFVTSRLNESNLGLETTENKLGDTTPLVLDGAGINLISSSGRVNQETVGAITVKGGAGITLERSSSGQIVLNTPSITRDGQATLAIRNTTAAELGSINIQSQKLFITGAAPTLTNGIVAPWRVNLSGRNFLSYDANLGFTNAPFEAATVVGGGGNAYLDTFTGTEIVQFAGGWGDTTLTGTKNVYALRVDEESATNDMTFSGGQINIWSGGLILGSDDSNRVDFNSTAIFFGNGTTAEEGIVYGGHSGPNSRFGGVVTANNLTFDGPGGFHLTNTSNAITGTIQMNGGRLYLDGAGTQGTATNIILHSDYANNFNGNQMADLRLRHNSATTTFDLNVTIGANVPYAQIQAERYSGTGTATAVQFNNLNILGTTGPAGTLLRLNNSNSNTNVQGTTTIGGTSAVGMNVNTATWRLIGDVTSAAQIIKTGDGVLRFDGSQTGFTGGFVLNRGEWRLNGTAANVAGTGDVELNFGTLRLASSVANTAFFTEPSQRISINGQVLITADRNGGGATNKFIGTNNGGQVITTSNSPFIIFNGNDITIIEAKLSINGSPTFRTDNAVFTRDLIEGAGTFNKTGNNYFHLDNNAANTFSGGYNNFTGVTVVRQVNATLGTGPVQVFAGSGLSLANTAQLGDTGLTKVLTSGTALPIIGTRTIANFNSITAAVAAAISGTGNGVLSIDANQSLAADPLMATRDDGDFALWNLGGGEGNGNLTANTVTPWGVGDSEFRLGGGYSTLTLNPTANSDQLSGAGNKLIAGVAHTVGGYGVLTINANGNNTFGGGTLVTRTRHIDGGYRGFVLSVQGGANGATWRTPLGTGQIDVFGDMRYEQAAGTAADSATTNANVLVLHPGARLRFDNGVAFTGTGGGGRWADSVAIALNSSVLDMVGGNSVSAFNSETVGDISAAGGSEVVVRRSTLAGAELIAGNVTRVGSGTLMLRHDVGLLGANTTAVTTAGANVDRFLVSNGASLVNNNMVDPWIVSRSENQFLKYDATAGFQLITQGGAPANYLTSAGGAINAATLPLNDGTEILNLNTATGVLALDADVYALRTDRSINPSADGVFRRITIRSGGLISVANTTTINPDLYFGAAGDGTGEAFIWANTGAFAINGKIFASKVTKSGTNFLSIQSDQPQFTGDWVINGGGIQPQTPNALGTGQVILNGAHMADNDNVFQLAELRYNFNSGTPDLFTWGGGKVTVNDLGLIRVINTNDRLTQISAVDINGSGGGHESIAFFQVDGARHTARTGTVTLNNHALISVDATSFGPGSTSGIQLGSGSGVGGLNNQGLYDVRLSGDGILSLGDNSASFTGMGRTFSVGDGTVRVLHNGAFGSSGIKANLRSTGVLEIAVANFSPLATVTQEVGSIERWAVSDARGNTGTYSLPTGVHLQVFSDITTPSARTIGLSGGSIMGYQPLDYDQVAVIQTIRSGVTVNLTANSYLGQIYPAGTSNGANHFMYDMGKLNTTTNLNPSDVGLRGSYLVIDGDITGNFTLTKLGQDVIKLAGNNTFSGLNIDGGIIQIGRNNALSTTVALTTRGEGSTGILDLNGYNQEIGSLSGTSGSINNSGFGTKILTVNQSTDTTYGGSINGSVTLTKQGIGVLTLTSVNEYQGGTILEGGTISVAAGTSLGRVHLDTRADSLLFKGGTLETTADTTIAATRGFTLDTAGGTISVAPAMTLQLDSAITGLGSLTKTGTGILQLNNATSNYSGDATVAEGTLQGGAANTFSALSRHLVTGDTISGTLALNGFDQTIGSLASNGTTPFTATVALGANTLTVGNDRTQSAAYAGIITGAGTFRVNGNGALQTLAVTDNSAEAWSTEIANGLLNLALGGKLGSGNITFGIVGVSGADDFTGLNLSGAISLANNLTITNENSVGSVSLTASGGTASSLTGTIALGRDTFVGATNGSELGLTGDISGAGRLVKIDAGTVRLSGTNGFGPGTPGESSGSSFAGSTLVRAGTVLLESNTAAGTSNIAIGDVTSTIGAAVDRATFVSILGEGTWNPNGDGVSAISGGQDPAATTGNGAFIGVSTIIDGFDYASSALGTRILVAGEEANPERNGIYVIAAINGALMNLVRADDYETANQMKYGGQVAVTTGTYAGDTFFMFEEDIVVKNETTQEPIRFRADLLDPDIAVLQNVSGLTVANNIQINATNGAGTVTVGGSSALTTGTGTFIGTVELQNRVAGAEAKTLLLTSSTDGSGTGVTFSGVISEADAGDTLSIEKVGTGIVTLTAANTYKGTTTVSEGKLQLGDGGATGSLNAASAIIVASGATFAVNQSDTVTQGTDFSGAAISGAGNFEQAGSGTTVLNVANTYTGATNILGGTLSISAEENLGAGTGPAAVNINGGTLQTTATFAIDDASRGVTIGASGGTIETATGTALTLVTDVVLTGNLSKTGLGELYVNDVTTGSGTVTVNNGTLGGVGTISGDTTIKSGATLTAGTRTNTVTETLTFSGNLTAESGSIWLVNLVQDVNGVSDMIAVTGNLGIAGAIFQDAFTNAFTMGNKYTIATYTGTQSGEFAYFGSWVGGTERTIGGGQYLINYADMGAITLTAVPEPGTLGFLGLALGGFLVRRIRRRAARGVTETAAAGE